jgi:hypothetical protein
MTAHFCSCPACQHVTNVKLRTLEASLLFDWAQQAWMTAQRVVLAAPHSERVANDCAKSK